MYSTVKKQENIFISYDDFGKYCEELVDKIRDHKDCEKLEFVYGIPNSGLPVALHMSKRLDIPLILDLNYASYANGFVLVCDNLVDTGMTINSYFDWEQEFSFSNLFDRKITAAIANKVDAMYKADVYVLDIMPDQRVVFPWEFSL